MIKWWQQRSLIQRLLVCAVAATLAFLMAAGVGAMTALLVTGDLSRFTKEEPSQKELSPSGQQGNTPHRQQADAGRSHQMKADAEQERADSQQAQTTYVNRVGDIQSKSVETFLDSHDKLLHYDALTADNIGEMQANQATLQELIDQVDNLNPPREYKEQYKVFRLAVNELHETTQLAYTFAADPTAATQSGFEGYDRRVNQAAAYLKKSNEMLGRDYKTIERVQRVSQLS
jgi:hypothetical protein